MNTFYSYNNPNLNWILVDDLDCANNAEGWNKDSWAEYSEICVLGLVNHIASQILIYPNPTKDLIYIESNNTINAVKIFDTLGRLVLEQNNPSNQLDICNLSSGLLFVKIKIDNGSLTKKVIKD